MACDLVGFFRPRLSGCAGKHYQAGADKALPAIVLAVVAAVGSVGNMRLPLLRQLLRADPAKGSEAAWPRRAVPQAGAALHSDAVLVVDAGVGVAALLTSNVPRFVARGARNLTARRNSLPPYKLPELALRAGNILAYVAATAAAVATGFWDRHGRPTCGRLRRVLLPVHFSEVPVPAGSLRKKASVTVHWPKGGQGHRRRKESLTPPADSFRQQKAA